MRLELAERIAFNAPPGASLALERAAILARMAPAELARRFVIDGLRASGYDLPCVHTTRDDGPR